jgi:5-methylcytosine-specific restriction endonuclease McrA
MTPQQFRSSAIWQKARAAVLSRSSHCALCGRPLYPTAPPRSRWSSSVDHVYPLHNVDLGTAAGRALATNPAALRAVHLGCNSKRGNKTASAARRVAGAVPRIFGPSDMKMRRTQRW